MELTSHITPMFAASGIEVFIIVIFAAISALVNWLNKRKQDSDWSDVEKPRPPSAPTTTPRKTVDWEEELRRMLGEVNAPPTAPPPVIREHKPQPPPVAPPRPAPPIPRPTMAVPRVFEEEKTYKGHCQNCGGHLEFPASMSGDTIACPHCHQYTALEPIQPSRLETIMHQKELTVMRESAAAYQRAEQLDQAVAARLQEISKHPVQATSVEHLIKRSAEVEQVVALLRRPQTARQAIVASVILGPPKALEV